MQCFFSRLKTVALTIITMCVFLQMSQDLERQIKGTLGKVSDLEIRVRRLEAARPKIMNVRTAEMKSIQRPRVRNKQEIGHTGPDKVVCPILF